MSDLDLDPEMGPFVYESPLKGLEIGPFVYESPLKGLEIGPIVYESPLKGLEMGYLELSRWSNKGFWTSQNGPNSPKSYCMTL